MRIIFMGSPDFAVPTLDAMVAAGHEVIAAYTQPPRPAGRGKGERPTPVEQQARDLGIEVRSPKSLRDQAAQRAFAELEADVAVVAAYGLILPQPILDAPTFGCLNVHASLLPRWRGAAPVQRAIMAGDERTGVTIMQMEAGLDTGPMLLKRAVEIDEKNAAQLTDDLATLGAEMVIEVLADLPNFEPIPQPEEGVTYAAKIDKAEAKLDFAKSPEQVERRIRAFSPVPGAWFELDGERYRILEAEIARRPGLAAYGPGETIDDRLTIGCGTGAIRPVLIQRAGRPAMRVEELLRGRPVPTGTRLS